MNQRVNEPTKQWIKEPKIQWTTESMNERMNE